MKIKQKQILPSLLCLLLAWATASCREENEMQKTNGQERTVTLNIDLGDKNAPKTPVTRAGVPDKQIDEIDVLTFIADPAEPDNIDKGIFHHRAQAELSTGADGKLQAKVRLFGNSSLNQHILVLANVRQRLNAMTLTYGMQTLNVTDPLQVHVGTDGKVDDSHPVPMAGILPRQIIDESYAASEKEVLMLRMFAKVTIDPGLENIHELHIYNGRKAGKVIPHDYAYDKVNKTVTQPTHNGEVLSGFVDYSPNTPGRDKISFYINEADSRNKAADLMNVTYLTVKATRKGSTGDASWYRIDLKDYSTGNFLDILRNHEYYIKLNESGQIQEPGGQTEEEARQGLHKLNVQIMEWVYKNSNVQAQGDPTQKRLAVLETDLTIDGSESILNIYAQGGGWHITGLPSWAQASQINGGNGWANVRISSRVANLTRVERHATIHVRNGRASMEVQLHQPDGCTLQSNGMPRMMKIGNGTYPVARLMPNGRCWMVQPYNIGGGRYYPQDNPPALPEGWRIPNDNDCYDLFQSPHTNLGHSPAASKIMALMYKSRIPLNFPYGVPANTAYYDPQNLLVMAVNGKAGNELGGTTKIYGIIFPEIKDFWLSPNGNDINYGWNWNLKDGLQASVLLYPIFWTNILQLGRHFDSQHNVDAHLPDFWNKIKTGLLGYIGESWGWRADYWTGETGNYISPGIRKQNNYIYTNRKYKISFETPHLEQFYWKGNSHESLNETTYGGHLTGEEAYQRIQNPTLPQDPLDHMSRVQGWLPGFATPTIRQGQSYRHGYGAISRHTATLFDFGSQLFLVHD